jgi:RimJ/RimL family protein N-acetyltransferase
MIQFDDPEHGYAIAEAAHTTFNPAVDRVISRVDEEGELLGGVIYTAFTEASIHLHMAGFRDHWANRDLLWCIFDYPFNQLGCKKVFGQVAETNTKALEIDLRLGFKIVTKIDDVYPDGGVYVLSMDKADCKWLSVKPRHIRSRALEEV